MEEGHYNFDTDIAPRFNDNLIQKYNYYFFHEYIDRNTNEVSNADEYKAALIHIENGEKKLTVVELMHIFANNKFDIGKCDQKKQKSIF